MNSPEQRPKIRHHNSPLLVRITQNIMRILMLISNRLAISFAYWLWFSSPKFEHPAREQKWRQSATLEFMQHEHGPIALYSWGSGPCIVLVHGWSGRGLQLAAFAAPLVEAGFRVIAFDAPGHGRSAGSRTTIFKIQQVLSEIGNKYGPLHGIVAHSFGVLVSALAIKRQLKFNKLICISSPTSARYLLDMYCETFQLPKHIEDGMLLRFFYDFGEDLWNELSAIENLKGVDKPILIIHDKNDEDVACSKSEQLHQALPHSELLLTEKLGHRRILRDAGILAKVTEFMVKDRNEVLSLT